MKNEKKYIIDLIRKSMKISHVGNDELTILNKGRFANAYVYRYKTLKHDITIKDFHHCPSIIRVTYGRLMAKKEVNIINKLNGINGITSNAYMLSPYTCAFNYVEGTSIKSKHNIPELTFIQLESIINSIHDREIVHLDLRNYGNIITDNNNNPYIIDFQTGISTKYFPKIVKELLRKIDISGVYKAWYKYDKKSMPDDKILFLNDFKSIRRLWPFKGYPITRLIERIKS